ncbi:hypothetical protein GQ600_4925 [Phytophthora cactorum]|nr:hypothetical protein GQ600_4925 [Phytophthora cactorum]
MGETALALWNIYFSTAGYNDATVYDKASMMQSWNKFCFQGGMIECTRVQHQIFDVAWYLHGLNANQAYGAPTIVTLKGGCTTTSSVHIGLGMPENFRVILRALSRLTAPTASTPTTALPKASTTLMSRRRAMRTFVAINRCIRGFDTAPATSATTFVQSNEPVGASLDKVITEKACTIELCPASYDVNADVRNFDDDTEHWGINTDGICFPNVNLYSGAFLCSAGNNDTSCAALSGSSGSSGRAFGVRVSGECYLVELEDSGRTTWGPAQTGLLRIKAAGTQASLYLEYIKASHFRTKAARSTFLCSTSSFMTKVLFRCPTSYLCAVDLIHGRPELIVARIEATSFGVELVANNQVPRRAV